MALIGTNFLYPRVISVRRSRSVAGETTVGGTTYQGREANTSVADPQSETVLLTGISASIQSRGVGRVAHALLPGNVTDHPQWRILTMPMPLGSIRDDDIIVDEEGYRYQVAQNYWTPMGYRLDAVRLET